MGAYHGKQKRNGDKSRQREGPATERHTRATEGPPQKTNVTKDIAHRFEAPSHGTAGSTAHRSEASTHETAGSKQEAAASTQRPTDQGAISRVKASPRTSNTTSVVAAVEIGAISSSWAFSFNYEYKSNPAQISSKQWGSSQLRYRAPTTVLIKPDGNTLEAFGSEAEDRYKELQGDGEKWRYFYFQHFVMDFVDKLGECAERDMQIADRNGRSLPATTVFSLVIDYMLQDMLPRIELNRISDALLILPVPDTWTESARQILHDAAIQGGVPTSNIRICQDMRAVTSLWQHTDANWRLHAKKREDSRSSCNVMYLNATEDKVSICCGEMNESGHLKEIWICSSENCGLGTVSAAFKQLLKDLFTTAVLDQHESAYPNDWLNTWHEIKRGICNGRTMLNAKVPAQLMHSFETQTFSTLKESLKRSRFSNEVTVAGNKLRINANLVKSLFDDSIRTILCHIKGVMNDVRFRHIRMVIMVGEYAEIPMLQRAVMNILPGISVFIPNDPDLSVLKGAVMFGHSTESAKDCIVKHRPCVPVESSEIQRLIGPQSTEPKPTKVQRATRFPRSTDFVKTCVEMGYDKTLVETTLEIKGASGYADINELIDHLEKLKMAAQQDSATQTAGHSTTITEERSCTICLDRESTMAFVPCGHVATCDECCNSVQECPVCRQEISGKLRTYAV